MALVVLFAVATLIRLFGINEVPLDFHPTKQFRSALTSRAYYYDLLDSIPAWKQEVARVNLQRLGVLHPPVLDRAVALAYALAGDEHLWIPRLGLSLSWVIGGVFLYLTVCKLVSADAAVASTAFYLLLPFGVQASQSYQIDPLMVMMMVISLFAVVRYHEQPSLRRLVIASTCSATAILLKPVCAFIVSAGFIALAVHKRGVRGTLMSLCSWVFILASVGPGALFYGQSMLTEEVHRLQAQVSFVPSLFLQYRFWDGWLKRIRIAMGFTSFTGGMIGALMFRKGWPRAFVLGLWVGYFVMCFAFNYTISTHDYYHLPLVPVAALSLGPIAAAIWNRLDEESASLHWRFAVWGVLFVGSVLSAGTSVQARRKLSGFEDEVRMAKMIGEIVEHSTQAIILAPYYGRPLMYYGEFSGAFWPYRYDIRDAQLWGESELTVQERFDLLDQGGLSEYFIIADMDEFEAQEDVRGFLDTQFPVTARDDGYVIFDLRNRDPGRRR